jgi:hypothetical protein
MMPGDSLNVLEQGVIELHLSLPGFHIQVEHKYLARLHGVAVLVSLSLPGAVVTHPTCGVSAGPEVDME